MAATPIKVKPTDAFWEDDVEGPADGPETWESLAKSRAQQIEQLKQALEESQKAGGGGGGGGAVPEELADFQRELETSRRQIDEIRSIHASASGIKPTIEEALELTSTQQEELEHYDFLLTDAKAELQDLKGQVTKASESKAFLNGTLGDYEKAYQAQADELSRLEVNQTESARTEMTLQRQVEVAVLQVKDLEKTLEVSKASQKEAKAEASNAKLKLVEGTKQIKGLQEIARRCAEAEDELLAKIESSTEAKEIAMAELEAYAEEAELDKQEMQQEIEMHIAASESHQLEIEELKDTTAAELEQLTMQVDNNAVDLRQARADKELAVNEKLQVESDMQVVLSGLKEQLAASNSDLEGAAMAGLSITEVMAQLRDDHAQELARLAEERGNLASERDFAVKNFEERNKMLTDVMKFMQTSGGPSSGEDGGFGEGDDLATMQERAKKYREGLEENLAEYEEENSRLTSELAGVSKRASELETNNRKLARDLEVSNEQNDTMSKALAEKTDMLEQVMSFVQKNQKKKGEGGGGSDYEDDGEGGNQMKDPFEALGAELETLTMEREELLDMVAEMEQELQASRAQHEEDQVLIQEARDEIESLESRLANMMEKAASDDVLKELLSDGEKKRKTLQSDYDKMRAERDALKAERDTLSTELAQIRAQLDGAAAGGLSLLELLEKLKGEQAAELAKLNARVEELESELAQHKQRLEALLDFLPPGEGDGDGDAGDAIEQLASRLKRALADKAALEAMLEETEAREQQGLKTIDELNTTVDKLRATIAGLQKEKEALEEELEAFRAGVGKAKAAAKALTKRLDPKYDDEDEEGVEPSNEDAIQQLLDALDETEARLVAAEEELALAMEEIEALTKSLQEANSELADLKDALDAAESAKTKMSDDHAKKVGKLNKMLDALRREMALKDKVIDDLKAHVARLEKSLEKEKKRGSKAANKILTLESSLLEARQEISKLQKKMRAALNWIRGRELRAWVKNSDVLECPVCEDEFTLMRRRHHCRICGGVFCNNCTSHRHLSTSKKKPVRACTDCKEFLTELGDAEESAVSLESKLLGKLDNDTEPLDLGTPSHSPSKSASTPAEIRAKAKARASERSATSKSLSSSRERDPSGSPIRDSAARRALAANGGGVALVTPLAADAPKADRIANGAAALRRMRSDDTASPFGNSTNASTEDVDGDEGAVAGDGGDGGKKDAALLGGSYLDVSPDLDADGVDADDMMAAAAGIRAAGAGDGGKKDESENNEDVRFQRDLHALRQKYDEDKGKDKEEDKDASAERDGDPLSGAAAAVVVAAAADGVPGRNKSDSNSRSNSPGRKKQQPGGKAPPPPPKKGTGRARSSDSTSSADGSSDMLDRVIKWAKSHMVDLNQPLGGGAAGLVISMERVPFETLEADCIAKYGLTAFDLCKDELQALWKGEDHEVAWLAEDDGKSPEGPPPASSSVPSRGKTAPRPNSRSMLDALTDFAADAMSTASGLASDLLDGSSDDDGSDDGGGGGSRGEQALPPPPPPTANVTVNPGFKASKSAPAPPAAKQSSSPSKPAPAPPGKKLERKLSTQNLFDDDSDEEF